MSKVEMSTELAVSPAQLWQVIGGFNALADWHPAVASSELEDGGKVRRLKLVGGGEIVERLIESDDNEHLYSYEIIDAPLPVQNYRATIRVRDAGDGRRSIVEWSGEFLPKGPEPDAVAVVQGIYQAGFDNLKKMFGG